MVFDLSIKRKVWTCLENIPEGKVITYGQLAEMAGLSRSSARLMGSLLRELPSDSRLPWHRVINHKGKIAFCEQSTKFNTQRLLLEKEGVIFCQGKVSLKKFQWVLA